MFAKVVIANRGEIARRIARTLRVMDVASAVVFHASDADAPAVAEADEAIPLEGEPPVAAYLDADQIVAAAVQAGADAVHPGYGFLSEHAEFGRRVMEAGLTFIGPSPDTIALMGDKIAARAFAAEYGLPVAPSATVEDPGKAAEAAATIGFPLLVKAAAGGGGRGMTIVLDAGDLVDAIQRSAGEAERAFADGRLYLERFVERGRHVEVQILGDGQGGAIHLGARDCSVQRRYQKIVEETPPPGVPKKRLAAICDAATALASAVRYAGAGTVEFLLAPDGDFYFLEMNTRLQVEHPVTEAVTGLDLVEAQIVVAADGALPFVQKDVRAMGHAIECRVYAEVPHEGFRPATGRVALYQPPEGPGIRVDSGVAEGSAVSAAFDPLLAKLIVHGRDRTHAIARMRAALAQFVLLGVETNIDYLNRVVSSDAFGAGDVHTGFVDAHADLLAQPRPDDTLITAILAAAAIAERDPRARAGAAKNALPAIPDIGAWRN